MEFAFLFNIRYRRNIKHSKNSKIYRGGASLKKEKIMDWPTLHRDGDCIINRCYTDDGISWSK